MASLEKLLKLLKRYLGLSDTQENYFGPPGTPGDLSNLYKHSAACTTSEKSFWISWHSRRPLKL